MDSIVSAPWHFDRFLLRCGYVGPEITRDILSRYAASVRHLAPNTQYGRLAAARVFARWQRRLIPGSAVIEHLGVKRPAPPRYYLYFRAEPASLILAARQMDETRSRYRRPRCLATLVGLLYATGLRIGEALALNVGDIRRVIEALRDGVVFTDLETSAHCDYLAVLRPRLPPEMGTHARLGATRRPPSQSLWRGMREITGNHGQTT